MFVDFYSRAKEWVEESKADAKSGRYLSSWVKTLPARANFVADAIVNLVCSPFNLLRASFGSIKAVYTWGYEAKDLKEGSSACYKNINHALSDMVGVVMTQAGCSLREKDNILILLAFLARAYILGQVDRVYIDDEGHWTYSFPVK